MKITDQIGKTLEIKDFPERIVSLVPSQTELLYDMGLSNRVVGITKFCVHPEQWHKEKPRIGGTKTLHIDKIKDLKPDLIIANKEENDKEQIRQLNELFPVFVTDVYNLPSALNMIELLGIITGNNEIANELGMEIKFKFEGLRGLKKKMTTAYLIWKDPFMTVGYDTFIHDMMSRCNLVNVYGDKSRYPEITIQGLQIQRPEITLLSSEPYPFDNNHLNQIQLALPNTKVILADGEYFSWYGSRLSKTVEYLQTLINEIEGN